MKIVGLGVDFDSGELLVPPLDEADFANRMVADLNRNGDQLRAITRATSAGAAVKGEVVRKVVDLSDPRAAGWTYLVNAQDPLRDQIVDALCPLAERRGMKDPSKPLLYNGESPDAWLDWINQNYSDLSPDEQPHYILIAGSPKQVPFLFQSVLGATAAVGRVDFGSIDDVSAYVQKLIRLETAPSPTAGREAVFFAPDGGTRDPTYYSCNYMVKPLAADLKSRLAFDNVTVLTGEDATKQQLMSACEQAHPAVVYTAGHGMGAPRQPLDLQKRVNGAICCQRTDEEASVYDWLFTANDVPADRPFLEGSVFFQFACFGYGTPAQSDFTHWGAGMNPVNASEDFVAALPKRLLAHPQGPIAFIGHLDIALLQSFDDPAHPVPQDGERWNERISPFYSALNALLGVQPAGIAMTEMTRRYNRANALLTRKLDQLKRGGLILTAEAQADLANTFLFRNDAQNYMIFGDPAACLRIPDGRP